MIRKYLLPLFAIVGLLFAMYVVRAGSQPVPASQPVAQPAAAPFASYIAGAGLIEARSENIAIGTNVAGPVTDVFVKINDTVKKGDKLFQILDTTAKAQRLQAGALLAQAQAKLRKLEQSPRPEELPPLRAKVAEAHAALGDAEKQLALWQSVYERDKRAVSEEDLIRRRYAVETARAKHDAARAELTLMEAGTWKRDLEIASADVQTAQAQVDVAQAMLDQLTVRAPIDATVLQVKIRPGEFAQAGALPTPLMVLGETQILNVRVDVDENDAWRFNPGAKAVAFVRGNRELKTELAFYRVEPYVVPKKSLTGESTERVDTRVLQVLYGFPRTALPVYVGQQMDVFIEAAPVGGGSTRPIGGDNASARH